MTRFSADVAKRFGLLDVISTTQLYFMQAGVVSKITDQDVLHTFAVALMLLERSGLSPEARNLILEHLVQVPGVHLGALAMFDGRFATLAPPTGEPVHLDIADFKVIPDPVRASGRRPIISTVLHLAEVYRICKEALHGIGTVP